MAHKYPEHPGAPSSKRSAADLLPERLQAILGDPASAQGSVIMPAAFMIALLERDAVPNDMLADFVSFFYDALCLRDNPYPYEMWQGGDV